MSDGAIALPAKENALFKQVVRCYEAKTWKKGIKTIYYIRLRQMALEGTTVDGCVSCML